MTADTNVPLETPSDEDPAVIIAWLRSEEADEWRRNRPERRFWEGEAPEPGPQAPGETGEDPCGRPPIAVPGEAA